MSNLVDKIIFSLNKAFQLKISLYSNIYDDEEIRKDGEFIYCAISLLFYWNWAASMILWFWGVVNE